MAKRNRRSAVPHVDGTFQVRTRVMSAEDLDRAIRRMAHEIIERNSGADNLVLIGLQTGGDELAKRLGDAVSAIEGFQVPVGTLDVTMHRDDYGMKPVMPQAVTDIPVDPTAKVIVLVDDVLYTGRTVRAALDAIHAYGRPAAVQLAVMVDRGHRELPIRPDFIGKNLPTRRNEIVDVHSDGVDLGELS